MILTKNVRPPVWLWEGLAVYISGQIKNKKIPDKFGKFLDYYDKHDAIVYSEACFAVKNLVEKYGKEKLLNLVKATKEYNSNSGFKKKFKEIYGFNLNYKNILKK